MVSFFIQLSHMIKTMRRRLSKHRQLHVLIFENQLGKMGLMLAILGQTWIDYLVVPASRYVAQSVNYFLYICEEDGLSENLITSKSMSDSLNQGPQ